MRYTATFPLLLNIADQPTYFMSLKGEDGLVKMYAMVNVQQYNIVETGGTVAECEANYRRALANNGLIQDSETEMVPSDQTVVPGTISEIRSAVMNGNTYYFFRLGSEDQVFYRVNAAENPLAVILNVGDAVELVCTAAPENASGRSIVDASSISLENGDYQEALLPESAEQSQAQTDAEQPAA